jgi:mono/diheme cytochrome c family protein
MRSPGVDPPERGKPTFAEPAPFSRYPLSDEALRRTFPEQTCLRIYSPEGTGALDGGGRVFSSTERSGRRIRIDTAAVLVLSHLALACNGHGTTKPRRELEISFPDTAVLRFSSEKLQGRGSASLLEVSNAPGYEGMRLSFKVVPMSDLLPARYNRPDFNVVFECRDGFAATISATRILHQTPDGPRAFLAVENPDSPWPSLKNHAGMTAGPFFLVWKAEHSLRPPPEEWPYQIQSVSVRHAQEEFRGIIPEAGAASDASITAGFQVFVLNCSPCHTLNGVGDGHMGPDLNTPMSPTEYFREDVFRKYVRSPGSVLRWPDQRMPSFSAEVISEAELSDLHAYLATMARRRNAISPPSAMK